MQQLLRIHLANAGLYLFDARNVPGPAGERLPVVHFEIGRFTIAPTVLVQMRKNIDEAIAMHEQRYGTIPASMGDVLTKQLLENTLKPPPPEAS